MPQQTSAPKLTAIDSENTSQNLLSNAEQSQEPFTATKQVWFFWSQVPMQFCNMFAKNSYGTAIYSQETRDAMMKIATSLALGFEEIGNNYMTAACNSANANSAVCKEAFGIFSPKDLMELQTRWGRQTTEVFKAETEKYYSSSMKLASQISEVIQSHSRSIWGK